MEKRQKDMPSRLNARRKIMTKVNKIEEKQMLPVIIGDGNTIIDYYPKNKSITNSRVILITNGTNICVPDMTNWSKREVKYLLDKLNIKYKLNGDGHVISQTIAPETKIEDIEIEITLSNKIVH